ncbi:MAG: hypothetical protein ACJ74W_03045 [Pyrinomonadaceae bacterium]
MLLRELPSSQGGEELSILFPKLCNFCAKRFGHLGCICPEQCGTDVVTKYLFDLRLRGPGRGEIHGEQIILNFPGANNQLAVLYALLKAETEGQYFHCKDCKGRGRCCALAPDSPATDDDEPRVKQVALVAPHNPEELYRATELIELSVASVGDPERVWELLAHYAGYTYEEIARASGRTAAAVRQRAARTTKKIVRALGINIIGRRRQ